MAAGVEEQPLSNEYGTYKKVKAVNFM